MAFKTANNSFMESFKEEMKASRRSSSSSDKDLVLRDSGKPERKKTGRNVQYESFMKKYEDFENSVEKFNSVDLVLYFKTKANEAGYPFYVSNMPKEAKNMKRLMELYPPAEICAMIEFLYFSEQDYLEKNRLSVSLMASRWATTIHEDTMLWVNDKYVPKSKKSGVAKTSKGEWDKNDGSGTAVGKWE